MIIDIDLAQRFDSAFGFAQAGYIAGRAITRHAVNKSGVFPDPDRTWADLVLTNTDNGKVYKMGNGKPDQLMKGVLCPAPMVSFIREKAIKETAIDNSDFQVVESFGLGAWDITIDGILVDMENHEFPYDYIRKFREIFEANNTFKVESDLFYAMGIDEIYFKKIEELAILKDFQDTAKFKLKAYSIRPLEYFLG